MFDSICKSYNNAIDSLKVAYKFIRNNNRDYQELETSIQKLQKELFVFKLPKVMDLYLPSVEDQNTFRINLILNEYKLSSMLEMVGGKPEERRSLVDNFTNAYIYEFLERRIPASQSYLLLFQQYLQNQNALLSVKCLEKMEALILEETRASDPFAISNFLEMLDRELLGQLLNMLSNDGHSIEYLENFLIKKDNIRKAFERHLHELGNLSTKPEMSTCFICFNLEEKDIGKWLENILVPDLDRIGIKSIFCLRDLGPGKELNAFQGLIRQSDLVIVVCTPLLKRKCDARCRMPVGVAQEIRLVIERYNDVGKYETIYPIYFKGDRKSSCPSEFLEPILGTRFSILDKSTESSVFTYYSNAFELFGEMRGITRERSREIKKKFLSETKNIIFDGQLGMNEVDLGCKNGIHRSKIVVESTYDNNITSQTKLVDCPPPPKEFTGREKEINDLHEACKSHKSLVITGLGGVGKTALVLKYADEYKSYYKFIYFITASSQDNIVQGLTNLADEMNISSGEATIRLKNLRNHLNRFEDDYLIIFDGIDHPEAFEELKKHLPSNRKCILLTSRMSEYAKQKLQFEPLTLYPWRIEEAVDYILKTTKSEESDQAQILACKLGCLPLALTHASAYIRTRGYMLDKYIEQFDSCDVKLFEEEYLELAKEEKAILTTWQVTLDSIENYHKCSIAKQILSFFSFLSQAPIPLVFIEYWFTKFLFNHSELELGKGLHYLNNYSMIYVPSESFYAVHLSVQNVIRFHLSSDEYHNYFLQVLNTLTFWIGCYDSDNIELWSFIKIIVPHCEMFIYHLQKADDSLFYTEDSCKFFKSLGIYFQKQIFFSKSFTCWKYCQKIAEKLYGADHLEVGSIFHNIGMLLQEQCKLEDAKAYYIEAINIKKKVYGTRDHPDVALTIYKIGLLLQLKGKFNESENLYRNVLDIFEKAYGTIYHIDVAKTISQIGMLHQDQGKFDDAEALYRKALEICIKVCGTNHPDVAKIIIQIGMVLQDHGNFSEAELCYRRAFDIYKNAYRTIDHPDVAKTVSYIGMVLQDLGELNEAELHYREAFEIFYRVYGTIFHIDIARTIGQVGRVLQDKGKLDDSASQYRESLEVFIKTYDTMYHSDVAKTIVRIAIVLQNQGKLDEAELHLQKAIEIYTKVYGTRNNIEMAKTIVQMGGVLKELGKLDEAEDHFREAFEIYDKLYGTRERLEVARTFGQIGIVLGEQGKYDEAEVNFREALEIYDKLYGTREKLEVARTIGQIGIVLESQGKFEEAEVNFREALRIYNDVYGDRDNLEVGKTIVQIGRVLHDQGKFEESEVNFREALRIYNDVYGDRDNLEVGKTIVQIGRVLHDQGKFEESEVNFREALRIYNDVYGDRDNLEVGKTIVQIGRVLHGQGEFEESEVNFREALRVYNSVYGNRDNLEVGETFVQIGKVLHDQGKFEESEVNFREALKIYNNVYGTRDNFDVGKTMVQIGIVLEAQGKPEEAEDNFREALDIYDKLYGTREHFEVARTIDQIGIVLEAQGKSEEAEDNFREAFDIYNKVYDTKYNLESGKTVFSYWNSIGGTR